MNYKAPCTASLALLGTRALVAAIFLWHGVPKAFDHQMAVEKFVGYGLPGILGPVTGIVEVIAGVLLFAGLFARPAAGILGVIILGALATVQFPGGVTSGLERDLLILVAIVVLLVHGAGAYTLDSLRTQRRVAP